MTRGCRNPGTAAPAPARPVAWAWARRARARGRGRPGAGSRAVGATLGAALVFLPHPALACPFCEVGARDAWRFIVLVVGSFIAGAAFVLIWSIRTGQFGDPDGPSRRVLELDHTTGVRF